MDFNRLPFISKAYHFLLAALGALVYGRPSKKLYVIGVTGTKGKTTTLELLNSILEAAGEKTAMVSSVRIKIRNESTPNDTENTMPDALFLEHFLRRAVEARCTVALIEITSQGIVLSRHRFIEWDIGLITNIAPEHMEARGSFEKYRDSKLEFLLYVLKKQGTVFINEGDGNSQFFINVLKGEKVVVLYSRDDPHSQSLLARPSISRKPTDSRPEFMLSDFNKDNIAGAEAVARYIKISDDVIEEGIRNFRGVPGRMEFVQEGSKTAVIDGANTPESLEQVYKALKLLTDNPQLSTSSNSKSQITSYKLSVDSPRLVCILGSVGERDRWKRQMFGKIAAQYCSTVILTNEDPYDEDPSQILEEIKSGIPAEKRSGVLEIPDRREAIQRAAVYAKEDNIIVVTGKGSDHWIHGPNDTKTPWSERKAVEDALSRKI